MTTNSYLDFLKSERPRRIALLAGAFSALTLASAAIGQALPKVDAVVLAPHRAVYELTFVKSEGMRGIDAARGRIVFEVDGAACESYTVGFRQVVELGSSEAGARVTDVRSSNVESGDGKSFRFVIDRSTNRMPTGSTEGATSVKPDGYAVALTKPDKASLDLPKDVYFPTAHTVKLIEAARAGENTLQAKVYDGSDDGMTVYDSLAVIGKPVQRDAARPLEEGLARQPPGLASWPVTISYFKVGSPEQTPIYVVTMELFENGVSRDLKLDYGVLVMKGELKQIEFGKVPRC